MRLKVTLAAGAVFAASFGLSAAPAQAGTIILEGSDAIGFHSNIAAGAATYRDEAFTAIGGADPRPIAVIGTGTFGAIVSGTHSIADFSTAAAILAGGVSGLGAYVALDFLAGGGCCAEDDSNVIGFEPAIAAFLSAGGTVMIQNYTGGVAWDFAVGAGGAGNAHVIGIGGGAGPGTGCDDGEKVTSDGMANGFVQPPVIGCWEHQGYDEAFFGPLGFTHSFFDAAPGMGGAGWSGLLSSGVTVSHAAPEPATLALFGAGLMGLGALRRRKAKKA